MRADRLLSLMLLLQVHRRMTASELAKRLEVSERTIYRDMDALGAAGIPVCAERGNGGGWMLLEEYRTNLTGLNDAEIQALFLSRPSRPLADLGLNKAADAALIKLLAALPSLSRRDAEYARQRIYVDAAGWHSSEENVASLPVLQDALWQEHKVHLTYQRSDNALVERLVDPLGLVAKGHVWYLVAGVEEEVRNFRVSRIRGIVVSEASSMRPADFDLVAYWTQSAANFVANLPRYQVRVRMAANRLEQVQRAGRYAQIERAGLSDEQGWIFVDLLFQTEESACGYLLSFGPEVEILEPPDLRIKVITLAERMVAFYTSLLCSKEDELLREK